MDWQIKPVGRESTLSGSVFEIGETIVCFIFLNQEGDIERADVRAGEVDTFPRPESILGRWQREVKPKGEEEREARKQALASAEELFISLYEMDESPGTTGDERDALKQMLALMLERKRVLRSVEGERGPTREYLHIRTRSTYNVPFRDLQPDLLLRVRELLETLDVRG